MKRAGLGRFELSVLIGLSACGDMSSEPRPPSPSERPEQSEETGEDALEPCEVPTEPDALLAYLRSGQYKAFARESAPHPSSGPHGKSVRTYVNDLLAGSLAAGSAEHPRCAASIKELYLGPSGVSGWAVFVKAEPESQDGRGYYWLEISHTDATRADLEGRGLAACIGCHSAGRDYFRAPWPLQ